MMAKKTVKKTSNTTSELFQLLSGAMPRKKTRGDITSRDHRDLSTWEIQNRLSGLHMKKEELITANDKSKDTVREEQLKIAARERTLKDVLVDIEALEDIIDSRR